MSKRLFLLTFLLAFATATVAQDVITLKNGDEINGKVTKVTSTEIEYKLATNPNGPTYTKPVADIFMVKYENGQKDVFNTPAEPAKQQQVTVDIPTGVTLVRQRGEIVDASTSKTFSEFELQQMLGSETFNEYATARDNYKSTSNSLVWSYTFFFLGPPLYWCGVVLEDGSNNGLACRAIGIAWTVFGNIMIPVNYITRGVAAGKISRIAESYNAKNSNLSMNLSGGFTLMPTAQGTVAPGIGISLRL